MADDALMESAAKAVERLLGPLSEKLRHIERELEPVRSMDAELKRIGQLLADRDTRIEKLEAADESRKKEIRDLQKDADQNKWVSRVAVALLLAGAVAWFQKSNTLPPIYVNVSPASVPSPMPPNP